MIPLQAALGERQRKNDCKGGMVEEWHQKLHNNTSPDDIVICQVSRMLL
nr:alpha-glucan water dikinase, chloroplastic isoform X1 [Ipomoea batatas]